MSVNAAFQHGINATVAALAFSLSNNINVVPSLPQSATNGKSCATCMLAWVIVDNLHNYRSFTTWFTKCSETSIRCQC